MTTFAYLTGWRTKSEIFTLEWRQVDLQAGAVRLEPDTKKNSEGRIFPFGDGRTGTIGRARQGSRIRTAR